MVSGKKSKKVVAYLKRRSVSGLEYAKTILRKEKIESLQVRRAVKHYFENWNDFIHPSMFSIAYEAAAGSTENLEPAQAAIAMVAAAFDLHDDVIDQSKEKYGKPTVCGKFGAEISILLGNAFLIEGFKLLVDSMSRLPRDAAIEALEEYKRLLFEVGNAHALEVMLKKKHVPAEDYMNIIEMKAAAFEADMHLGAVLGGADSSKVKTLSRIGRILGTLATLRDEFVDVFELDELRQRISTRSLPLPILLALEDKEAGNRVASVVSKPRIGQKDVDRLLDIVFQATLVIDLKEKMQDVRTQGLEQTLSLDNISLRRRLHSLFEFMLEDL